MRYVIIFLLVVAFVVFVGALVKNRLDKPKVILIGVCILIALILGGIYTILQDKDSASINSLQMHFEQGNNLLCDMDGEIINVSKNDFSITSGIKMLRGKADSKYANTSIEIDKCKISH